MPRLPPRRCTPSALRILRCHEYVDPLRFCRVLSARMDDFHDTCTKPVRRGRPRTFAQGLDPLHPSAHFCFLSCVTLPCTSASVAQSGLGFVTVVAVMLSSVLTLGWMRCWMSLSHGWQPLHACMTQSISLFCFSPYRAPPAVMSAFAPMTFPSFDLRRTVHLCRGVCIRSYATTCGMFSSDAHTWPASRWAHSFRISSGRGGIAPPGSAQRCYAPLHKPRSSSGRGGIAPPGSAQRCYAPSHKPRSSSGRGGTAPSGSAPRKCRSSSGPGGKPPPVSVPHAQHGTRLPGAVMHQHGSASSSAHVPSCTERVFAHTASGTLRRANVARRLIYVMPVHTYYEAMCPFRCL
jgi:hypothetical protein